MGSLKEKMRGNLLAKATPLPLLSSAFGFDGEVRNSCTLEFFSPRNTCLQRQDAALFNFDRGSTVAIASWHFFILGCSMPRILRQHGVWPCWIFFRRRHLLSSSVVFRIIFHYIDIFLERGDLRLFCCLVQRNHGEEQSGD